ncbi:hypothetical protein [Streptomyces sp. CS131]|uniref:hypothetical protein n=1 Tax=Streptomyces sp. CS131 TaxID=2162711 RepID=UPI000D513EB8|nr:hypothetical protein [Streptomyces sp. CS131]PVC86918.1 hypothetical protein DBP20_09220 [Streptomyces sp. CS131]
MKLADSEVPASAPSTIEAIRMAAGFDVKPTLTLDAGPADALEQLGLAPSLPRADGNVVSLSPQKRAWPHFVVAAQQSAMTASRT